MKRSLSVTDQLIVIVFKGVVVAVIIW